MKRLAKTLKAVIKNHPALLTTFHFNDDGEIVQRYTPNVIEDIHVEKVSEFEFESLKDNLVMPFKIIDGKLYRCRVFETEKAGYVFFDVHHTIFDGTSLKVFMGNIGKVYAGMEPDKDFYYYMLAKREEAVKTDFYDKSREYFENLYENVEWSCYPTINHQSRENELGELFVPLGIEQAQMAAMERQYRISRNEFFITVALLAIAFYNKKNNIKISWIYNGREDLEMMSSVGLLFRDLPVGVQLKDKDTIRDIFADVHNQVQGGIEHSCYAYVDKHNQVGNEEAAYLLYQQDIRDMDAMGIETIDIRQNQAASQTILDMEILDGKEGLILMIDYAASRYNQESMERFRDLFVMVAQSLATHSSQKDITVQELRKKLTDKSNFFAKIIGFFRRKK